MSYDDWKTDPEYGMSHRDLREAELQATIDEQAMQIAKLHNALDEILDIAKEEYDVEDDPSGYGDVHPNKWMRLGNLIEEVLGRGGRYGF